MVIENQLDRTDHGHLGQLLLYASGLEATAVVWVAPRFRDEFRRALDWLNERTDTGVDFFGVEISVVQIGDSGPRAPVSRWWRGPTIGRNRSRAATAQPGGGAVSPINAKRQDFFMDVLTDVVAERPVIRMPARSQLKWISYAAGPFGHWGIFVAADGRLRVEVYLDSGDRVGNKQLFDELAEQEPRWSTTTGTSLSWERLDDKRACRIATYHDPVDLDDAEARQQARQRSATIAINMYDALNETLRRRARDLRGLKSTTDKPSIGEATDPAGPGYDHRSA